jgi:hypothetical protein
MMLQKLMAVASLDCDMSNEDFIDDYTHWVKMQSQINNLVIEQRLVNDQLITARVLGQEGLAKIARDSKFYASWTNIVTMLNDIKLESYSGKNIEKSLKDLLWYYKEAQKESFVDLYTAKYWFEFLQRLESIYQKQCDICIALGLRECEAVNIYPIGADGDDTKTAQFWVPIAKKLQDCVW